MTLNLPARRSKNEAAVDEFFQQTRHKRGKLSIKHRMLAEYAARGYSTESIARAMGMTPASVLRVLAESQEVWDYINEILSNLFREGDMLLVHLYKKALTKLDAEMESTDPEIRQKAIEKVLKQAMLLAGKGGAEDGGKTLIAQFFGAGASGSGINIETLDEIIIKKRKERGLE